MIDLYIFNDWIDVYSCVLPTVFSCYVGYFFGFHVGLLRYGMI